MRRATRSLGVRRLDLVEDVVQDRRSRRPSGRLARSRRMEYHGIRREGDSRFIPKRGRAMASPFPGMDPYLEYHWGDIHSGLVIYIREAVAKQLPRGLPLASKNVW